MLSSDHLAFWGQLSEIWFKIYQTVGDNVTRLRFCEGINRFSLQLINAPWDFSIEVNKSLPGNSDQSQPRGTSSQWKGPLHSASCLVLIVNLQIPWRGNTQMGREHAYGLCASSRLLKVDKESASATEAGMLFHSGMVRKEKERQSGECLSLARGRCKLSWFLEPRAGLLARDILIVSGGIAISPWSVLYIRVKRWCRRRSANSLHPSFLRRPVTLATPYSPQAQRAAFLWTCSRLLMSFLRVGSHTVAQYSSWDLTRHW